MKQAKLITIAGGVLLTASGCVEQSANPKASRKFSTALVSPDALVRPAASLEISDSGGRVLYQQTNPGTTLTLARGSSYQACLQSANPAVSVNIKLSGSSVVSGPTNQCYTIQLAGMAPGNYPLEIIASLANTHSVTQNYNLAVTCPAHEIANLRASDYVSGISVALDARASTSVYRYQPVGGRLAEADCAIDFNGDQIVDSEFAACTQSVVAYSNHVGNRNLKVHVREKSCNATLTTVIAANLPYTKPTDPPFIDALVQSNRAEASRTQALNLHHLSFPTATYKTVTCGYANGVFTIQAYNGYAIRRGVGPHGLQLTYSGLTGEVKDQNVVTTANTKLSAVRFVTDQNLDVVGGNALTFAGSDSKCKGTITVQNLEIDGVPCDPNIPGQTRIKTLLIEGSFGCSGLGDASNANEINIGEGKDARSASFACSFAPQDACLPGGQSGGVPPTAF